MPYQVDGTRERLPWLLSEGRLRQPGSPAVIAPSGVWSYERLADRVDRAAAGVRALGVGTGDRVGLYGSLDVDYLVALLGVMRAGAVACPLSTRVPGSGLGIYLHEAGCRLLLADGDIPVGGVSVVRLNALVGEVSPEGSWSDEVEADRWVTAVFTSGSTGRPRAALHSFGNHCYSALGAAENMPLVPGDRWLLSLPVYHVGGLAILFRCLWAGAAVVLPAPETSLRAAVEAAAATHVSMVATQLYRMVHASEDAPPAGLKRVLLGGSAIPASLVEDAFARGWPVHTSYGLTEMASQVTTTPPGAGPAVLRSSGRVLPYRQLEIAPDGEIRVRGETRFAGYLVGGRLQTPFDADGWFATGDLGYVDAAGFLHVIGRKDNLFISGGENIQPEEIEAVLCRVGGVVQAAVVPVPDAEFGQRPVAFVHVEAEPIPVENIAAVLEKELPRFKHPDVLYPWPHVPGEQGMKVSRRELEGLARRRRESDEVDT